jgi:hypothetical protein
VKFATSKENKAISKLFVDGTIGKTLYLRNDIAGGVNKLVDIYNKISSGGVDETELAQMVGDVQRSIARSREEGKLTDDDIRQASGQVDFDGWISGLTKGIFGDPKTNKEKLLKNVKYAYDSLNKSVDIVASKFNNQVNAYNRGTEYVDIDDSMYNATKIRGLKPRKSESTSTSTSTSTGNGLTYNPETKEFE